MTEHDISWTEVEAKAIRKQLDQVLESNIFAQAERQSRFLRYIVDEELAGRSNRLNQYLIGLDVFDRDASFDPVVDSIVRVEARRLRSKLMEYYSDQGKHDQIAFHMPKGRYKAKIQTSAIDSKATESNFDQSNSLSLANSTLEQNKIDQVIEQPSEKLTIAVLPFDNLSKYEEEEYFSDGISEDIITDLSKISSLLVIARHSTFVYKGKSFKIKDIGEDLGVNYVLEGSVRRSGDQLRINAQLIDAATENHIWAERFDRKLDDIFVIQDEVSRKIVQALELNLTGQETRRLGHRGTDSTAAHDFFLRAKEQFYQFTLKHVQHAIELFSKAIEIDPNYAEALAWKSRALVYSLITGLNPSREETLASALQLARKATDLDELLPSAHADLGWALLWNHEVKEALTEMNKALELDTNFADGYLWQSMTLSSAGKGQAALHAIEKAIRINPHYTVTYLLAIAVAHFTLDQYDEALTQLERGIQRNPNFFPNQLFKAAILGLLDKVSEAEQAKSKIMEFDPKFTAISYDFFNNDKLHKQFNEGLNKVGIVRK